MSLLLYGFLLVALLLLVLGYPAGRGLGRPRCQWTKDPTRRIGWKERYVCGVCGAEASTRTGRPPRTCQRPDRSRR